MAISETPVMLPLGRDRLLTKPVATGSPPDSVTTIGMVVVAFLAATAAGQLNVRITSTLLATRSLASCGSSVVPAGTHFERHIAIGHVAVTR